MRVGSDALEQGAQPARERGDCRVRGDGRRAAAAPRARDPVRRRFDTFRPTPLPEARRLLGLDPQRPLLLFAASPALSIKNYPLAEAASRLLSEQGVDHELLVVDRETQERLALYMSACDVLVFPSYNEGSPNVVKQAMACDLPIVATDVGDVAQVVGPARRCVVSEGTPEAFAHNIGALLTHRERSNGRACVIDWLGTEAIAARVIDVFERARPTGADEGPDDPPRRARAPATCGARAP